MVSLQIHYTIQVASEPVFIDDLWDSSDFTAMLSSGWLKISDHHRDDELQGETFKGAAEARYILIHNMGVHFSCFHICMPKEFLKDTDVDTIFQHGGRETVAQGMAGYPFVDVSPLGSQFYSFLQAGLHNMVPPFFVRPGVDRSFL